MNHIAHNNNGYRKSLQSGDIHRLYIGKCSVFGHKMEEMISHFLKQEITNVYIIIMINPYERGKHYENISKMINICMD